MPAIGANPAQANSVPAARQVIAGNGLDGGGDLTVDRTLTVEWGTGNLQVRHGNDGAYSDARSWVKYTEPSAPTNGQAPVWDSTSGSYVPVSVSTTATGSFTITPTKTSAYTMNPGEYVPVDSTSAAVTLTLPTSPAAGTRVGWKLVTGTNTLTVTRGGTTDVFTRPGSATTSVTAALLGQGAIAQYDATNHLWLVQADDLPLSQLDTRYVLAGTSSSPDATSTVKGVVQLAGDFGGTAASPTVPGLTTRVPTSQRGPLGGVTIITYAATVTPDASASNHQAVTATGNVTVAAPTNPTDGQKLMVEVFASGGTRTATISGTTTNASGTTLPLSLATGKVGLLGFSYSTRAGHWLLIAATAEP